MYYTWEGGGGSYVEKGKLNLEKKKKKYEKVEGREYIRRGKEKRIRNGIYSGFTQDDIRTSLEQHHRPEVVLLLCDVTTLF